jgi:hypothetical protein
MILGGQAKDVPRAIGYLCASLPELEAAVRAVEAELADAREFDPFTSMGTTFTSAHLAAIDYAWGIVHAVSSAASQPHPLVDSWGPEGVDHWANSYRELLSSCGMITVDGETIRSGPNRETFRGRFWVNLPAARSDDLQATMRNEIARWVKKRSREAEKEGLGAEAASTTAATPDGVRTIGGSPATAQTLGGDQAEETGMPPALEDQPIWDKDRFQLLYKDVLCLQYTRPAPYQHLLLEAFQEMGWPERIDDPLPSGKRSQTISDLQKKLRESNSLIMIERDGTGKGFSWRVLPGR